MGKEAVSSERGYSMQMPGSIKGKYVEYVEYVFI